MLKEVEEAYHRAQKILETHGCRLMMDLSPEVYPSLPKKVYEGIGIGAATGLWRGMHSKDMKECPFEKDWPMYSFWKAGFEYRTLLIKKGIYID